MSGEDQEARIRQRAYELWEAAGRPEGQADSFWYQASTEVTGQARALSDELDQQLADTFPASDPPSVTMPGEREDKPKAPEDEPLPARSATLEELPDKKSGAKAAPKKARKRKSE
ncbi:DUF2934 domain-containing protein [Roseomonas sp. KE0001]|uniref:DUF2934 domain-containing protein n=1 Tax=unclassified Roseomonas TaxID=2617492 RepID=UPI0018DF2FD5|nr:DUF2934 domain-containing protein [Roseomonas sp. KE0001]MBI0434987.1 DUF2934 domain-containing protein [Roseomonas sp. KE0001]